MDPTQPITTLPLSSLLLSNIVSAVASGLTFVLLLGSFQYFAYRKWLKKLEQVRLELENEYGQEKVAAKMVEMAQKHGTKN